MEFKHRICSSSTDFSTNITIFTEYSKKSFISFKQKFANNVKINGNYINNTGVEGSAIFFNRAVENVSICGNFIDNQGSNAVYMVRITEGTLTVGDIVYDYNSTGFTEVSFTGATGVTASVIDQLMLSLISPTIP